MKSIAISLTYSAIIDMIIMISFEWRQNLPVYSEMYIIYSIEGVVTKSVQSKKGSFLPSMKNGMRKDQI